MKVLKAVPVLVWAGPHGLPVVARCRGPQKKSPEFAVTTKAPLVIPRTSICVRLPGAPPSTRDPSTVTEITPHSQRRSPDRGQQHRGSTPGERMLLANAKAQNSDPAIRARLNADQRAAVQNADRSFTDRILSSKATPDSGKPVNADAEIAKGRKTATTTKKKKESGGWFDWF
jgi:hypothetical protein